MFRFTIRDVLWLTVVVAMAIGWMVHVRSIEDQSQVLRYQLMEQRLQEAQSLVNQLREQQAAGAAAGSPNSK